MFQVCTTHDDGSGFGEWFLRAQGADTSVYLRQYKADGTVFWNHVFVAALRNNEGKIINYVGIQHPLDKVSAVDFRGTRGDTDEKFLLDLP